jgi:PAS domain S-box-containing protein
MPQWRALTGQSVAEVRGWGWLDAIHPDDRALTREVWTRAIRMRIPCGMEYRVRTAGGEYRWYDARGIPVLAGDGTVREWIGVCIDITGRKQIEDKTRLLAREVNHRASNLLTIINAMMRQTRAETAAELVVAMQARIGALARVQTRLARDQWDRTDLLKLVSEELAPFGKDVEGRFRVSGFPVPLSADAAQALAIFIHELATNAVKYGALSQPAGRVAVRWAFSDGRLTMSWTENGGPPVSPPGREGFGTRAIALLAQQLGGKVAIDWRRDGLACELSIPSASLDDMERAGTA